MFPNVAADNTSNSPIKTTKTLAKLNSKKYKSPVDTHAKSIDRGSTSSSFQSKTAANTEAASHSKVSGKVRYISLPFSSITDCRKNIYRSGILYDSSGEIVRSHVSHGVGAFTGNRRQFSRSWSPRQARTETTDAGETSLSPRSEGGYKVRLAHSKNPHSDQTGRGPAHKPNFWVRKEGHAVKGSTSTIPADARNTGLNHPANFKSSGKQNNPVGKTPGDALKFPKNRHPALEKLEYLPNRDFVEAVATRMRSDSLIIELDLLSKSKEALLVETLLPFNKRASEFVASQTTYAIKTDSVKYYWNRCLLDKSGKAHWFSAKGTYLGFVVVNEPTWFYGRVAGEKNYEYLSMGINKTSRAFIKNRFPTIRELVSLDWAKGYSSLKHVTIYDPHLGRNFRAAKGFCWLPLFLSSTIPISKYPTSPLQRLNYLQDLFGKIPLVKSGEFYHYTKEGKVMKHLPNVLVGVEITDSTSSLLDWGAINDDNNLHAAMDSIVKKTVLKETSNFQNSLDSLFDKALASMLKVRSARRLSATMILDADDFQSLKEFFRTSNIENGLTPAGPHALLNSIRAIYNQLYARAYRCVKVTDVGGNLNTALLNKANNLHLCLPLLDPKDVARQVRSVISILNRTVLSEVDKDSIAQTLQALKRISTCTSSIHKCKVPATIIQMVDVYDVHIQDLLTAMENKGALISRLCFMYPPELIHTDGEVVHDQTRVVARRSGDRITYLISDTSDSYTHDVKTLLSYITAGTVVSKRNLTYTVELLDQNGPYMDFQISLAAKASNRVNTRRMVTWSKNKTEIRLLRDDGGRIPRDVTLILDRDFVRRVLGYAANVCTSVDDRTYEYVLSNIRSQTTMMIVGSKIVHNKVDISNDILVELPGVFLREGVRRRRETVNRAKEVNSTSFLKKVFGFIFSPSRWIQRLLKFLLKALPYKVRMLLNLVKQNDSDIRDLPDAVETELSNESGIDLSLCNTAEGLLDTLRNLNMIRLMSEKEVKEESEEDALANLPGLRGAGNANWYDFILPKKADAATGDCKQAALWRMARRLDRFLDVMPLGELCRVIVKPIVKFILWVFRVYFDVMPEEKRQWHEVASTSLSKLWRYVLKCFTTSGSLGRVLIEATERLGEKACNKLKYMLAVNLKALDLSYPKEWLNEKTLIEIVTSKIRAVCTSPISSSLLLLAVPLVLCSKTCREKLLGYKDRFLIFWDEYVVPNANLFYMGLVGLAFRKYDIIGGLGCLYPDWRYLSTGFLGGTVIADSFSVLAGDSNLTRQKLLLKLCYVFMMRDLLKPKIEVEEETEPDVINVLDVKPDLSPLKLSIEVQEIIENFKRTNESTFIRDDSVRQQDPQKLLNTAGVESVKKSSGEILAKRGGELELGHSDEKGKTVVKDASENQKKMTQVTKLTLPLRIPEAALGAPAVSSNSASDDEEIIISEFLLQHDSAVSGKNGFCANDHEASSSGTKKPTGASIQEEADDEDKISREGDQQGLAREGGESDDNHHSGSMITETLREQENLSAITDTEKTPEENSHADVGKSRGGCKGTYLESILEDAGVLPVVEMTVEAQDADQQDTTTNTEVVKVNTMKSASLSLRPNYNSIRREVKVAKRLCDSEKFVEIYNLDVQAVAEFLVPGLYKNMHHYVQGRGNAEAIFECLMYSLHELSVEVQTLNAVVQNPKVLVGKKKELFVKDIPELNRVTVLNNREDLHTKNIKTIYACPIEKQLMFSNDYRVKTADRLLALYPTDISFPLVKTLSIRRMLFNISTDAVENVYDNMTFINAVPGAGKTHEIKQLMKDFDGRSDRGGRMMVVTSARSSAESLSQFKLDNNISQLVSVQTIDSACMSVTEGDTAEIDTLLIDECYMSHAGQVLALCAFLKPRAVRCYGDRRQVPFINRSKLFISRNSLLSPLGARYEEKLETYRCPADICWWMSTVRMDGSKSRLYSGDVKAVRKDAPLKSVEISEYDPTDLSIFQDVDRIMTFTQMEKIDLQNRFQNHRLGDKERARELIGTVAESQGETYERVNLVRFKTADDQVFASLPHRLVSLTRHTASLRFICVKSKMNKGIGKDCSDIQKLEQIVAARFKMQQHV